MLLSTVLLLPVPSPSCISYDNSPHPQIPVPSLPVHNGVSFSLLLSEIVKQMPSRSYYVLPVPFLYFAFLSNVWSLSHNSFSTAPMLLLSVPDVFLLLLWSHMAVSPSQSDIQPVLLYIPALIPSGIGPFPVLFFPVPPTAPQAVSDSSLMLCIFQKSVPVVLIVLLFLQTSVPDFA